MSRAYASHASPPARPPIPRPARPPAQHVAETRYRDSSRPPVRNRLTYGWGYGVRESRARPSFPVSIRHTRDVIGIRVKETIFKKPLKGTHHCPTASTAMYLKLFLHTIFFFITNVNEACDKSKVWNMSNGVSEKN